MNANSGRLAFRVDGDFWKCYYAVPDTMEGAIFLGSIHMHIAYQPKLKEAFMNIMKECLNEFFKDQSLDVDHWDIKQAPDHERTKE
jgi:hypothetical protein